MLNEGLAEKGISLSKVSETLDIERTIISKYINGQRVPSMEVILKVNRYLLKEPYDRVIAIKLIIPFIKSIQSMKVALELAMLYRDKESKYQVINMIRTSSKPIYREWGEFYELFLLHQDEKIDELELLDRIIKFKTHSDELEVFREIMIIFYHFNISADWPQVLDLIQKTKPKAEALPDSLLKSSYLSRLYNFLGTVGLRLGALEVEESRKWLQLSSEHSLSELTKFSNTYNLGTTFQFSNPLKGCELIERAATFWEKNNVPVFSEAVPYIRSSTLNILRLNADAIHEVDIDGEISNEAKIYYYIKKNDYDKARTIYEGLTKEEQDSEFILYCKGVIDESIPILFQSFMKFVGRHDFFEAKYPADELMKLGIDTSVLEALKKAKFNLSHHQIGW